MARGIHDVWVALGEPSCFDVVEMGAGTGIMANHIIDRLRLSYPELAQALQYQIVEVSEAMIKKQQHTTGDRGIVWHQASAEDVALSGMMGVVISNELPDTFPVHRIKRIGGEIIEVGVGIDRANKRLVEVDMKLDPELYNPFYLSVLDTVPEGVVVNASPTLRHWQHNVARMLDAGSVITIDYGFSSVDPASAQRQFAPRLYQSGRQMRGDILEYLPGEYDITTSVDFNALREAGNEVGLSTILCETQPNLLRRLGIIQESELIRATRWWNPFKEYLGRTALFSSHLHDINTLISPQYDGFLGLVQTKTALYQVSPQSNITHFTGTD
ncbi:SAM-dependent methyltransferase [Candidatus Saccharibacteria bacterium]|nr:MAG: SAM-dependent methyltransferase [Candidatus Saccharibacteria bacterium]